MGKSCIWIWDVYCSPEIETYDKEKTHGLKLFSYILGQLILIEVYWNIYSQKYKIYHNTIYNTQYSNN